MNNTIVELPSKLKAILDKDQSLSVRLLDILSPFSDILKANHLYFFKEYTDHGIKHIENTLQYAENLIADETFQYLSSEEVGVIILSVVLHDIGMHTNAEMFKNMIDGQYDDLKNLMPNGKTWKELWDAFLYDSQYWSMEKKENVFGNSNYIITKPNLSDLQLLTEYDKKLIGEFIRIHHCRIAHEVSKKGYIGRETIPFKCSDVNSECIEVAGIVARSHGMDVRDTFDYLEEMSGDSYLPFGIHAVYLMVLLRLADYLQIDGSRTSETLLKINNMNSPFSRQEHKSHLSIKNVQFENTDKEKIQIQANPQDAQTFVKIERLAEDIQKEFDCSWAILGEVYSDYNYKLRFRRITTNISNEKYRNKLEYVPEQFGFSYNNDLFKLLIAPLYGDDPTYGVRELVQNAVDACRLCLNDESIKEEPYIVVEVDTQKSLFTITDTGKGMNLYEIKNYFLTIGSSYNDNIDWKKERDQQHLYRTGRFGIGVLAAFLLGSEISVVTKKRGENIGYRFTASLNSNFIQIEKVQSAPFGTNIEIRCDEKCMNKLKNNSDWLNWYVDAKPSVKYILNGETKIPKLKLDGYKELKHSSEKYGTISWRPFNIFIQSNQVYPKLYCNGFKLTSSSRKKEFLLSGCDLWEILRIPDLRITDRYNQLPLNLQRNQVDKNVIYDFEPELVREVFIDILCQMMAIDLSTKKKNRDLCKNICNYIGFFLGGFSLKSDYISNCVGINKTIHIDLDGIPPLFRYNKLFPVVSVLQEKLCYDNELSIRNDRSIAWFKSNINKLSKKGRLDLVKVPEHKIIQELSKRFGSFAIIDNNSKWIRLLDNYLCDELYKHRGWFIFDMKKNMKDLYEEIISLGNGSFSYIYIEEKEKKVVPATPIDELFEKYMGRDPIVPFDMDKRKVKFPLLFSDYQDVISQYAKNKKYK